MEFTLGLERQLPQPPAGPVLDVSPRTVDFGEVLVGDIKYATLNVDNVGLATLQITSIQSNDAAFIVLPPTQFNTLSNGPARAVNIVFSPTDRARHP